MRRRVASAAMTSGCATITRERSVTSSRAAGRRSGGAIPRMTNRAATIHEPASQTNRPNTWMRACAVLSTPAGASRSTPARRQEEAAEGDEAEADREQVQGEADRPRAAAEDAVDRDQVRDPEADPEQDQGGQQRARQGDRGEDEGGDREHDHAGEEEDDGREPARAAAERVRRHGIGRGVGGGHRTRDSLVVDKENGRTPGWASGVRPGGRVRYSVVLQLFFSCSSVVREVVPLARNLVRPGGGTHRRLHANRHGQMSMPCRTRPGHEVVARYSSPD